MVRVISFLVILALIISLKTASGVNLFVVAAGAFIVAFKDFLLSIVAFFFVLPQYKIGETIGISEMQGQIIFIRMFSIGILGKDNDGDSTGKLYLIPSNKFITESIRKEDLHTSSIRKELLRIPYKTEQFSLPFDQFLLELEDFLSKNLPTLSKKTVDISRPTSVTSTKWISTISRTSVSSSRLALSENGKIAWRKRNKS